MRVFKYKVATTLALAFVAFSSNACSATEHSLSPETTSDGPTSTVVSATSAATDVPESVELEVPTEPDAAGGPPPPSEWLLAPREVRRVSDNGITMAIEAVSVTGQRIDVIYSTNVESRDQITGVVPANVRITDNTGQVFGVEQISEIGNLGDMSLGIISFQNPEASAGAPISLIVRTFSSAGSVGEQRTGGSWAFDFLKRGDYSMPFEGKWVALKPASRYVTVEPPVVNGPLSPFSVTLTDDEDQLVATYYFQILLESGVSPITSTQFDDAMKQILDTIPDRYSFVPDP